MTNAAVKQKAGSYQAKDFSGLLGMEGLSDALLKNHFKLYEGYVTNTNALLDKLDAMTPEAKPSADYSELRRRLGFEFCGMRLHELYFGNLAKGGKPLDTKSALAHQIEADFGDFETFKKHFVATGMMRGVGWAVLYYDPVGRKLVIDWINEHQVNNLPGCKPILAMDVWEHAFMLDYQLDRAKYVEAFWKNINWQEPVNRFGAE